jgi:tetratricopeptide (TPR) repeat protein
MSGNRANFFISHAGADQAWAEWVAWQLTDAGYTVELDVWDWAVGQNFVTAMSDALDRCDRVIALFSAAYFERRRYTTEEWTSALVHLPGRGQGRLLPVWVEKVSSTHMPAALRTLISCDLYGLDAAEARRVLLAAAAGAQRPGEEPAFPDQGALSGLRKLGSAGPRLPGRLPRVWNLPARNPGFTGRDRLLMTVRDRLLAEDRAVVQAFQGMGGVGKTQLAVEYAYRFASSYGLAWWVDCGQPELIADQMAALGVALGCIQSGTAAEVVRPAVLGELRERDRWLLVFDNAGKPGDIRRWLPGGGHVLITSRQRRWAEDAVPVEVDVLARAESAAILQDRVAGLSELDADRLADRLGDLPLAITQAAGFIAQTGIPAGRYVDLLETRAGQILDQGAPGSYPRSLAAVTELIIDRLTADDLAAAQLARLCAFLAPDPIPQWLFTEQADELPGELGARAADWLAWGKTVDSMTGHSLARVDHRGIQIHRLTQAILRDSLTAGEAALTRSHAEALVAASVPRSIGNPAAWLRWEQLMPHVLAADLAATGNPAVRELACNACEYLLVRGEVRPAYDLASDLHQQWSERLGNDGEDTRTSALYLAWALREMGQYAAARDLDQDNLDHHRRFLGDDDPVTLASANNLAVDLRGLGDAEAARTLDQDILGRRRRLLGDDAVLTIYSANNLASDLRMLGEIEAAHNLDKDTVERCRRILGDDHPGTLLCSHNLAIDLYQLKGAEAARGLAQDILDRQRRVLGNDHPITLSSADFLTDVLRDLGEVAAARHLERDTQERYGRVLGDDHPKSALGLIQSGKPEVAAAIFEAVIRESPNDGTAHNNYGFCILPQNPEVALDSFTKASQLQNNSHLITLANTVLALHLLGRDVEALALGTPDAAAALPGSKGWMWLVSNDHELELSDLIDVRIYLEKLLYHIRYGSCSSL